MHALRLLMHTPRYSMHTPRLLVFLAFAILVLPIAAVDATAQSSLPLESLSSFDTVIARAHVAALASDEMQGRNTPSPQLMEAAEYIGDAFDDIDVEEIGSKRFADYTILLRDILLPTTLTLVRGGDTLRCTAGVDFIPFENTGEGTITNARLVAVGYGITAPEYNHDDYKGLDVKGAVVLVVRGQPNNGDTTKGFRGKQGRFASSREKLRTARELGAAAVLMIDSPTFVPPGKKKSVKSPKSYAMLTPRGHTWPALFPERPTAEPSVTLPGGAAGASVTRAEPFLHVGARVMSWLYDSLTVFHHYVDYLDTSAIPASGVMKGVTVSCHVALRTDSVRVPNVVGIVRGSEIPDEYVVVGAHFDHVGVDRSGKKADSIYNGADDNASGVAGLLMVASALSKSKNKPKRSVLFIAFSGEEKGLFGSEAYVASPLLPLAKCVAMINMDMIGRCEQKKLSIGGSTRCPDLAAINETENAKSIRPFSLAYDIEQYFFRSDQANFAKHKIPVIFYFTGEHSDYHQVGDEIHKINFTGLTDIARIAGGVVWQAANQPRSAFVEKP